MFSSIHVFLVHLYVLEKLSIKLEYFHKNVLVTSAKRITLTEAVCSVDAKKDKINVWLDVYKKNTADKTEFSDLHFTFIF